MLGHLFVKAAFVILSLTNSGVVASEAVAQHAEPNYAKWGKVAMEETVKTYQNASIVDYKYEGRQKLGGGQAEERFKLRLRQDSHEFGVRVSIRIKDDSDTLINVKLNELDRK